MKIYHDFLLDEFVGAVISSLASASLADKIGRKPVVFIALAVSFIAVGIEFHATTNPVFFAGKLLNGIMVGTIGSVMISYIGEVNFLIKLPQILRYTTD